MPYQESRVKKSLLNARVNLFFYFLTLALSFFSRKIFLDCLGADFIGLTGTLYNLLGFLNLAELGIGSAIGYVLYKPLFDHDQTKINEIISVMGYLYRWIGLIILGTGCVLACFLPLIFPNTGFNLGLIYFAYFSFLASSLIGYFINYRQNLLGADQRNYVVTAYYQSATIFKTLIQMASAYYTGSYYIWVTIELTFGIVYSFILNWKIDQTYPWLKSEVHQGRQLFKKYPEVMKYTKQLFVHRISAFAQFQVSPILIYSFVSLRYVTYYTNYTLLIDKLNTLLNNFLGSTSAGVGNLLAEGNKEKIMRVYWELFSLRFFVTGIMIFILYEFMDSLILLWLGKEYILPKSTLLLLLINLLVGMTRGLTDPFLYGYGLFNDTWAPVLETILYVVFSCVLGWLWGLNGILLGTTISTFVVIGLWKPFFLFHKGFKVPLVLYWRKWLFCMLLGVFSVCIYEYTIIVCGISNDIRNWSALIFHFLLSSTLFSVIFFCLFFFFNQSMRELLSRIVFKK